MIIGGVCGYREYEDWVWAYLVQKDVRKAAERSEAEEERDLFPPLSQTRRISAVTPPPEEAKPAAHRRRRQAVFTVIQSDKQVQ